MTEITVPVFDGNHYENWSLRMKTLLKAIDLWDVVELGIQQVPPREFEEVSNESSSSSTVASEYCSDREWKQWMELKDTTALHVIQNGVNFEIFPWIACARSSKEAWELLLVRSLGGPIFQSRKLVDLKKEYKDMRMGANETVHEFTGKLMELMFRMESCGWKVGDKEVVKKIVSSLPPRFDNVFVEVAETLEINVLIDCLLVHEYNMKVADQESAQERRRLKTLNEMTRVMRKKETINSFFLGFILAACLVLALLHLLVIEK